jgi:hypothetical protein
LTLPSLSQPRPGYYRRCLWNKAGRKRNGVHYVGDEVAIPFGAFSKCTADFEQGVNGQPITSDPDEGSLTPWTLIEALAGNSVTYSSEQVAHGSLAAKIQNAGAGGGPSIWWKNNFGTANEYYGRLYLYYPAWPASAWGFLQTDSAGQAAWSARVLPTGIIELYSAAFSLVLTFTTPIATNQWIRIEYHANHGPQTLEMKLFNNAESTTPTEVVSGSGAPMRDEVDDIGFGGTFLGEHIYMDDVVAFATSYPGPYSANDHDPNLATELVYTVRNYFGKIVSQGTTLDTEATLVPAAPTGGWKPGWYRVYLTGPEYHADYDYSYGVTNFCVIRDDPHFVAMPGGDVSGGPIAGNDFVMKGVMGLGTSRISIEDAEDPTADIANAQQSLALTIAYWADNGIPDPERPAREPWVAFPNGGAYTPEQIAGVTTVVQALYPDCKYYEGPLNEPAPDSFTATKMQEFADAVHAGNANAKAIGPCPVAIGPTFPMTPFLDADGGDYCDAISFHAYNAFVTGDLNLGRFTIQALKDDLAAHGQSSKPLWQTESVGANCNTYGIYHPRRARKAILETLVFEQMGLPFERNPWWYDVQHGFWDVPAIIEWSDGSLDPHAVLGRVLAEETWGKPFASAVDFGTFGNAMYMGNVYTNADGASTLALMATSFMTGGSITLTINGTSDGIVVVDGFGNERTLPQSKGRITLSMTDIPTYVRLPSGASASVYRVNGHSPLGNGASISPASTTKQLGGVTYALLADDAYMTGYGPNWGIAPDGLNVAEDVPSDLTLVWSGNRTIERVIIWCGPSWQSAGTIIKADVQTFDGSQWITRKQINKPTPPWFYFGSDGFNSWCVVETYWDEQWIHDVELDSPISCQGVRINVTEASYGGEPVPCPTDPWHWGGGHPDQGWKIQEVAVVDSNRYAAGI